MALFGRAAVPLVPPFVESPLFQGPSECQPGAFQTVSAVAADLMVNRVSTLATFKTRVKVTFLTWPRTTPSIYMSIMHMLFDAYVYQAQSRRWAYEGASS